MDSVASTPSSSDSPAVPLTGPRPFHRRLLMNTLATGAGNVWAMAVSLVSVPLLLHGLGPVAFGTYALLMTFSAVNGWFSLLDLGVWTAATREIAAKTSVGRREDAMHVVRATFAAVGATGGCAAVVFAFVGPLVLPTVFRTPPHLVAALQFAILAFSGTIVLDLMTETAQACLEGFQRVDLSRACDAFRRGVFAVATCTAALTNGGLRGVAAAGLGGAALGAVVTALVLRRQLTPTGTPPQPLRLRALALFRMGRTVALLRPLGIVERAMNRTIVGVILGPAAVTLVEIASQVQNGADAVLSASSYAVVPGASWLHARADRSRIRELLLRGTKYATLATAYVSGLAMLLVAPLMRLWIGAAGNGAVSLARLGLLSVLMVTPVAVGSNLLLGTGRAEAILRAAGAAIAVNLLVSVVLVHAVGPAGAFIGTLVANLVVVPILASAFLRTTEIDLRVFVHEALRPTLLPLTAMVGVVLLVLAAGWSDLVTLGIGTIAGTATFVGVVHATFFSPEERRDLVGAFRQRARTPVAQTVHGSSVT